MLFKVKSQNLLLYTKIQKSNNFLRAISIIDSTTVKQKDNGKLYLPVHVDEAGAFSVLYGRSSWAGIQRHRFTAQAQKQDERDNGSFFFKTPHHQVQAGHSGDQHPAKGPIVRPATSACLSMTTDCLFI